MKNKTLYQLLLKCRKIAGQTVFMCFGLLLFFGPLNAGTVSLPPSQTSAEKTLYGLASFYAQKFHGRKTANGEIFDHAKLTAACNVLPLGTWLRVTNLKNKRSIVVKTNDRLHPKTRRIIDLSYEGAQKLGYVKAGLTRVKIEILKR